MGETRRGCPPAWPASPRMAGAAAPSWGGGGGGRGSAGGGGTEPGKGAESAEPAARGRARACDAAPSAHRPARPPAAAGRCARSSRGAATSLRRAFGGAGSAYGRGWRPQTRRRGAHPALPILFRKNWFPVLRARAAIPRHRVECRRVRQLHAQDEDLWDRGTVGSWDRGTVGIGASVSSPRAGREPCGRGRASQTRWPGSVGRGTHILAALPAGCAVGAEAGEPEQPGIEAALRPLPHKVVFAPCCEAHRIHVAQPRKLGERTGQDGQGGGRVRKAVHGRGGGRVGGHGRSAGVGSPARCERARTHP